ncbi:hypothetical protein [Sphingomonas sp.]|uniref:hypothetical protein n=1 Tax=Sphingomonas sp. TaxID=28214 RepID=UPI001B272C1E|nr:hypothetical protein [Sphingomonas sp.]MBO9713625.1 hypothetical protein [Sphingomonas sp.]
MDGLESANQKRGVLAESANQKRGILSRMAPAFTLMLLAPLMAEVLPGATRFSSIFVFPIEMAIWGGGAVMIRELVRRGRLGWGSIVLLALCLAIAEEFLIQQTSVAPLVIRIQGVEYGRALGINYVYLLWAVVYEAVLVVLLPVMLTEMLFPSRRHAPWLTAIGWVVHVLLFALATPLAWYGWTQVARIKVFHQAPYSPPLAFVVGALAAILVLGFVALGPLRRAGSPKPLTPPAPTLLALGGAAWAALWFGLEVIAFGALPSLPPAMAVGPGLAVCAALATTLPGWSAHSEWSDRHRAWLIAGTMIATMAIFFLAGFDPVNGATDFWFKAIVDAIATILFVPLVAKVSRRPAS